MGTIKERVYEFCSENGIKIRDFERACNLSNGYVSSMRTGFGHGKLNNVLLAYPDLNRDWLLYGEGEMLRQPLADKHEGTTKELRRNYEALSSTRGGELEAAPTDDRPMTERRPRELPVAKQVVTGGIPLIPIDAMAGFASGNDIAVLDYECEHYVVPMFREADFLIPVKGSSMIPKYNSGDLVACKRLALNDIFFQWNHVYVLDTDQGPLIKRVKSASDKEHILCVSDNPNYDPFELHISQIHAIALVVGVIRLE